MFECSRSDSDVLLLLKVPKIFLNFFFLFCLFPSLSWAVSYETLIFGPVDSERETGKPVPVITNFSVPQTSGVYELRIQNGNPIAVTSAVITLNSEPVAGPKDFNKQVETINVPVQLLADNILSVELRGKPGSGLAISIIEQIECPAEGCAPHIIYPVLETQYRATSLIPTTGGSISTVAGNGTVITLTIPDGGLVRDTEISITPVNNIFGLPLIGGLGSAVQFEPDGLVLAKPATLTMDLPTGVNASELFGVGWFGAGNNIYLQPTSTSGNQVTFLVPHFSGVGAGAGDPENIGKFVGAEIAEALKGGYLTFREIEEERLRYSICGSDGCIEQDENNAFLEALTELNNNIADEWLSALFDLSIESAQSTILLDATYLAYKSFSGWVMSFAEDFLDSDDVQAVMKEVLDNFLDGVIAEFSRINAGGCDAAHDREIIQWQAVVLKSMAAEDEFNAMLESRGINFSDFGCQLIIEVDGFPSEMVSNGDADGFSIRLMHRTLNLPLYDVRVHILSGTQGACALIEGFSRNPHPLILDTSTDGRIPEDPSSELEYSVGNCSEPTSSVIIDVTSGTTIGDDPDNNLTADDYQFIGKRLVLEASVSDTSLRISPTNPTIEIGETLQFTAEAPGVDNPIFSWATTGGSIDENGLFSAGFVPGNYQVTATLVETGTNVSTFVEVEGTAISISPASTTLSMGESRQFSATVLGPTNTDVTWTAQGGSIDFNGLYTAGNNSGQYFITATSVADPSVTAVASVTIGSPVSVASEYGGTATDSRFPNATSRQEVRVFMQEIGPGSYLARFHYRYRPDLGRGAQSVIYTVTLDGDTLSGIGQTNGTVVDFTGILNGDTMTGTAVYSISDSISPNCLVNGCRWEFEVLASPR